MADLRCAWWNVHNLFPFVAGKTGKDWPAAQSDYDAARQSRAATLEAMPSGLPHLAAFCEMAAVSKTGGPDVLADLCGLLSAPRDHYLARGCDDRGITLGVLWDPTVLELAPGTAPVEHPVRPELLVDTEYARPVVEV